MSLTSGDVLVAANAAPIAFNALFALTALGAPIVGATSELLAQSRSKVFYRKYAQQLSALGFFSACYILLIAIASYFLVNAQSQTSGTPGAICRELLFPGIGLFGGWASLYAVWKFSWKTLKDHKGLHMAIGYLCGLCGFAGAAVFTLFLRGLTLPPGKVSCAEELFALITSGDMVLPILIFILLLSIVLSGGLGLVYLVIRRTKDDWGRDYYSFAVPYAAKWAFGAMILALIVHGWSLTQLGGLLQTIFGMPSILYPWAIALGLYVVCAIIWCALMVSKTPLRLKALGIVACLLLFIALSGCTFASLKLILMS